MQSQPLADPSSTFRPRSAMSHAPGLLRCGPRLLPQRYPRERSRVVSIDPSCLNYTPEDPLNPKPWRAIPPYCSLTKFISEILLAEFRHLGEDLEHGDAIDVYGYRGCGMFLVGFGVGNRPTEEDEPEKVLIQMYGEYGYGVPPDFSAAPEGYFDHLLPFVLWADPYGLESNLTILAPSHLERDVLADLEAVKTGQKRIEELRMPLDVPYDPETNLEFPEGWAARKCRGKYLDDSEICLVWCQHGLPGYGARARAFVQFFLEEAAIAKQTIKWDVRVVLFGTLLKGTVLPKEIVLLIAEFVF